MTGHPGAWVGLALAVSADRVLVSAEGARLLVAVISRLEQGAARNGGLGSSAALRRVRDELALVSGTAEVRKQPETPVLTHDDDDWMPALEAAEVLAMTREYVGRLARDGVLGPSRLVAGRRLVLRAEVAAYAADRDARMTAWLDGGDR